MKTPFLIGAAFSLLLALSACGSTSVPSVTAQPTTPNTSDAFNITLVFPNGSLTTVQKAAFQEAASRWSQVITAGLPDVTMNGQTIDDLRITATAITIDGAGKILGRAGPEFLRNGSNLPITGIMEFDAADLKMMEQNGTLKGVILHEMGHVLGIGTLWNSMISHNGGSDCLKASLVSFGGLKAKSQYLLLGKTGNVPVENQYSAGTKCGHWSEALFKNELMTGFVNMGAMPLSKVTVGALEDLGYRVNYNAADAYALPLVSSQGIDEHGHELIELPTVPQVYRGN
ncbi:leishmanolysin-related zinc metalloendopeptidase [Deinococcus cellulosilyticus]|uniref:Peptidase n=1 Tax=Deinococcus cellulosilyticus (strain DSM 18568 / NBRC 106333 / KACC 11606 / 5516J-15) TaxID=1223518 RepID=A0A511N4R6_DEIC1|nr:leishmanolysin-related zinc metalloendopeptidase [Deinococcus cellulosilyticus]GEM47842.1 hypothetical protein DC3_34770 [Deinococcus cellulosilyticus NBRC 106333 = KACC 11606]